MKKLSALWILTTLAVACTTQEPPPPPATPDANTCGDKTCQSSETATSCPEDCKEPDPGPVCNNNVCEAGEETSCPNDCPATLVLQNNSSYTVYNLYASPCGAGWTGDLTGASYLAPGQSFTLTGIPPGCWSFRATTYNDGLSWTSPPTTMAPNTQYNWPLGN